MRQGATNRRRRAFGGKRLRRGLGGTAVAAIVMAALTASQAPGVEPGGKQDGKKGHSDTAQDGSTGDDSYHTELPPLETPNPPGGDAPGGAGDESGIPASVLDAYKKAAKSLASSSTGCGLRWEVLAAIGKVESGQARGGAVDENGTTLRPILGPVLNGQGFASIKDTDGGKWDDDAEYDRAVGPMQFIPSTWSRWGADGNGDGRKDPNNVYDAALAAGEYLCADGRDLAVKADLDRAILSYNHSNDYLRTVLSWFDYYRKGTHSVPDGEGALPTSPGAGGSGDRSSQGSAERGGSGSGGKGGKGGGSKGGSGHSKPGKGGSNGGSGGGGGQGGGSHSPSPSPKPTAPSSLKRVGAKDLTAAAGESFAKRPQVKAATSSGKGVKGVHVRFEIRGETGASFAGGIKSVAVATNSAGVATAPALSAGGETGSFTVRASAPGKGLGTVDFAASVTAPRAEALARTGDAALEAEKNGTFANAVEVKATRGGKAAAGVAVTAALADMSKGPFFKDADGKPLRTLQGLKTDANGILKLPPLYADATPGTYTLTLTATGGAKLEVKLTIKG
ncbi:lytic transglycosylase domain-containing protein [Streptomyces sp. NBC_01795]|uniref:lytic transglycosylase domain-containing protein n=1 Tax=Streptomyces sp. NBC_01795 TaxID=2975943 RepID=UPI002DDC8CBA|nr:lytic transglycosylase domain-containing protein [Streptomyces sp. NBC_01795]WSA95567.1 lytic transglycosylase domain-containing protein [Streptomyces sp. NBC_01795]